jgi:hypothetical protein
MKVPETFPWNDFEAGIWRLFVEHRCYCSKILQVWLVIDFEISLVVGSGVVL